MNDNQIDMVSTALKSMSNRQAYRQLNAYGPMSGLFDVLVFMFDSVAG